MSSVDQGQRSNKENLARLRKKNYFDYKITKYKLDVDALNLKTPSKDIIDSNRAEVSRYLRRKRIANFLIVTTIVIMVLWVAIKFA